MRIRPWRTSQVRGAPASNQTKITLLISRLPSPVDWGLAPVLHPEATRRGGGGTGVRFAPGMLSRRNFIQSTGAVALTGCSANTAAAASGDRSPPTPVELPALFAPTEREQTKMPAPMGRDRRVGIAIVGLGRLSLEAILPAMAQTRFCKPVALVSGDRAKAQAIAAQYDVDPKSIYDYKTIDRLKDDRAVELVYIVLPNGLHLEYTTKAFEAGKHVLCEKPMANTAAEAQQMIDASNKAKKKLMIAYRCQYEPHHREVIRMARAGELGALKGFFSSNGQTQGDPNQWRLKKALAGGGALPDIGLYSLNAARYLTGEEPVEITASVYSTPNDPRFVEVEEAATFNLRFPSGLLATCLTSYASHGTKTMRLLGEKGWAEMDPAFSYEGLRLRTAKKNGDAEEVVEKKLAVKNQFALELDHMARCILDDKRPHTPGEEGLQDMKLMASIMEAANGGHTVKLPPSSGKDVFRGPPP